MKLISEGESSGRPFLNLRITNEEALILRGLINNGLNHTPKTIETEKTIGRMKGMKRCLYSKESMAVLDSPCQP